MTSWAMYGRPQHPDTLVFYRYRGIDDAGATVVIDAETLLSVIGRSAVASKTRALAAAALSAKPSAASTVRQVRLTEWLQGLGRVHNHRYPDQPVHTVELIQCSLPLDGVASDLRKAMVWRAALNGGGTE